MNTRSSMPKRSQFRERLTSRTHSKPDSSELKDPAVEIISRSIASEKPPAGIPQPDRYSGWCV